MKKLLTIFAVVFLCASAFSQTTATITAHLADPGSTAVSSRAFVRAELKNTGGQQCRVASIALVTPYVRDFTPNLTGDVSFSIYKSSSITCGSSTGNTQWAFTVWKDGKPQPSCFLQVTGNVDLTNTACLNSAATPVTVAPTDSVYARVDGTNSGFTGNLTSNGSNFTGLGTLGAVTATISGNETVGGTLGVTGSILQTAGGSADMEINHVLLARAPNGLFPLGGDIAIDCRGSSDCWIMHSAAKATTSSTLNVGSNSNVLVANISPTSSLLTSFTPSVNAAWIVGRGTPNEEYASSATIVDSTHVNITVSKSHTVNGADNNNQPLIDIEQGIGNTVLQVDGGGGIVITNINPSQQVAATDEMIRIQGSDGVPYMLLPQVQGDAFPRNAVLFHAPISATGTIGASGGQLPAASDLLLRNFDSAHCIRLQNSTATSSNFAECDTSDLFGVHLLDGTSGGTPASGGAISLIGTHSIAWRNVANSGDDTLSRNGSDQLVWTGAGGTVTLPAATGTLALVPTVTLKKGSGGGNYTSASTTYVVVDSTNLCYTVTIPTGWKLLVNATAEMESLNAGVNVFLAITDNGACATANSGILAEEVITTPGINTSLAAALNTAITGDGASHNIALQFKTNAGADSVVAVNASATRAPMMTFLLTPSN